MSRSSEVSGNSETERAAPQSIAIRRTSVAGATTALSDKTKKLVEWNVDVLTKLLKKVVASRKGSKSVDEQSLEFLEVNILESSSLLDEVRETIALNGQFKSKESRKGVLNAFAKKETTPLDPEEIKLDKAVVGQLHG